MNKVVEILTGYFHDQLIGTYNGVFGAARGYLINSIMNFITNSLKYIFPKGNKGQIIVDFHPPKDDHYKFKVKDNRIGFPEDIDFQKTDSLGLLIVK